MVQRNITKIILFFVIFLTGIISIVNSQESNVIDNMEIVAIRSMEVESGILTLVTEIKNSNKEKIKLTEGSFTFYLKINKEEDAKLTKDEELGTDSREREIILERAETLMNTNGNESNEVSFEINLGKDSKSLERIINAIGNPLKTNPIFYINGKFYLGVKSDKGWSSVKAEINWVFKPELQEKVLLKASLDLPVPDFPKTEQEAVKKIEEVCRACDDVKFNLNSATLTNASKAILDKYIKIFTDKFDYQKVVIAGYACELGADSI